MEKAGFGSLRLPEGRELLCHSSDWRCLTSQVDTVEQCKKGFSCPMRPAHAGLDVCVPGNRSAPVHSLIHVTCTCSGHLGLINKATHAQ